MNNNVFEGLTSDIPEMDFTQLLTDQPRAIGPTLNALRNKWANSCDNCNAFVACFEQLVENLPTELVTPVVNQVSLISTIIDVYGNNDYAKALIGLIQKIGVTENVGFYINQKSMIFTDGEGHAFKLFCGSTENATSVSCFDGSRTMTLVSYVDHEEAADSYTRYYLGALKSLPSSNGAQDSVLVPIWDAIASMNENADVCELLSSAMSALMSSQDTIQSKLLSLSNTITSTSSRVQDLARAIYLGWAEGGFYGVIQQISGFIKGPASATVDASGRLVFSDANSLVPISYGSGILAIAGSVLTAVGTALAAAFGGIWSVAVAAIGSVISSIAGAVGYAANVEERAAMTTAISAFSELAPHGMARLRCPISRDQVDEALAGDYDYITLGELYIAKTFGGFILFTISDFPEGDSHREDYYMFSWEFHPDIVDRRMWFRQMGFIEGRDSLGGFGIFESYWGTHDDVFRYCYLNRKYPRYVTGTSPAQGQVQEYLNPITEQTPSFVNQDNGVLGSGVGNHLGEIVAVNTCIFYLFLHSEYRTYELGSFGLKGSIGVGGLADILNLTGTGEWSMAKDTDSEGLSSWSSVYNVTNTDCVVGHSKMSNVFFCLCGLLAYECGRYNGQTFSQLDSNFANIYSLLGAMANAVSEHATEFSEDDWSAGMVKNPGSSYNDYCWFYPEAGLTELTPWTHPNVILDHWLPGSGDVIFAFKPPKYIPGTVMANVITGAVLTAAVTVVTVVVAVKASRAIARKRTQMAANAEAAWGAAVRDPSKENVANYRKAVRKNNLFASIFGGTKYNKSGFWSETNSEGQLLSGVGAKLSESSRTVDATNVDNSGIDKVVDLIVGAPSSTSE